MSYNSDFSFVLYKVETKKGVNNLSMLCLFFCRFIEVSVRNVRDKKQQSDSYLTAYLTNKYCYIV